MFQFDVHGLTGREGEAAFAEGFQVEALVGMHHEFAGEFGGSVRVIVRAPSGPLPENPSGPWGVCTVSARSGRSASCGRIS